MFPSEISRERYADGIVHLLCIIGVTIGCGTLMFYAAKYLELSVIVACAIYSICMLASFYVSASYHLLPKPHWRDHLKKMDHAAIYALIAGTYTPLLVHVESMLGYYVLGAVWMLAVPIIFYKILGPKMDRRWSLISYLGLGWMGVLAIPDIAENLSNTALIAMCVGGFFYSFGTIFYARKTIRYRYAIWHTFVLLGTSSFFIAVCLTVFNR